MADRQQAQQSREPDARPRIEWSSPLPVEPMPLPPFPTARLGPLARFVDAAAANLQVPVDLVAFAALATISTATGGRRYINVRPSWTEITALWMAGFADSSSRKTPALNLGAAPLRAIEARLSKESLNEVDRVQQEIRVLREQMAVAEKTAVRSNSAVDAAEADSLRERLLNLGDGPHLPRLLVRDATMEAIATIMHQQDGRVGSLASEGGLFKIAAGLYSKSGHTNTDLLLEAYSGGPYTVDRVSRVGGHMARTFLSLGLIVQPGIVAGIERKNPEFREAGMLGRFLYCMPADVDDDDFRVPPIPESISEEYASRVAAIVDRVWLDPEIREIRLTQEAETAFEQFHNGFGRRRKPGGDLHSIADWAGKLRGNIVRLAACLALYENPGAQFITTPVIENCIALVDYFVPHAKAVFSLMGEDPESNTRPMQDVLVWLRNRPEPLADASFRDVWQGLKGKKWATDMARVTAVCQDLATYGWIYLYADEPNQPPRRGRKPSPRFAVHPLVEVAPNRVSAG